MILTKEEIQEIKGDLFLTSHQIAKKFAPIFQHNEWKWSVYGAPHVPTQQEIRYTIDSLIKNLYHGQQTALVATGRIQIRVTKYSSSIETRVELVAASDWL